MIWTDRTKRIRDAKSEAQKEIEEYRSQKENEYKKFEAEVSFETLIASRLSPRTNLIVPALEWIQDSRSRCE